MVAQSFIVDFLGKSAGILTDTKKKEPVSSGSYPKFIDTLNTTVDKNSSAKNDRNIQRSIDINAGKRIDKSNGINAKADEPGRYNKIKSYKDTVRDNGQISADKEVKSHVDKNGKLDKENEDKAAKNEESAIEESLAAILNISVEELKKVLGTLNISPEDLTDESKTSEVAGKISGLFGLNSDQSATLTKITEFIVKESKSLAGEVEAQHIDNEKNVDKDGWVRLEGIDLEVVEIEQELQLEDAATLGNKLKEILNKLEEKLENEPEKLFDDISNKMEEVAVSDVKPVNMNGGQKDVADDLAATASEENMEVKVSKNSTGESGKSGEKEADTSSEGKTQRIDLRETNTGDIIENNTQDIQQSGFGNILNEQQTKMNGANEVSKVQSEVSVSKKEIITQIVEKAKVVLTDDKSEMVIDLKPDHLGKLSLKVVTERGAVVAKFVAESEQVKAAIESNMDNLKESLTKQGFSIQGFSVSVGQDSGKSFAQGHEFSKNNSRIHKGDKIMTSASVGVSAIEKNHEILNPYMVNTSSINLTA